VDEFDLTPNDPKSPDEAPLTPASLTTATLFGAQPLSGEGAEGARSFAPAEPERPEGARVEPGAEDGKSTPLFSAAETGEFRARWSAIQAGFVDEPRKAVEQADGAVAQAMTRLAEMFAEERASLEGQWDRGDDVSTEDLRLALRRYRSFFDRLLSV
jgi:hypothetical protein